MQGILFAIVFFVVMIFQETGFKADQMRYPRVRTAYEEKGQDVESTLVELGLDDQLEVYLRVFKMDSVIELWGKNKHDTTCIHIKDYKICALSGSIGPKRRQGDFQVPEGFYTIDRFNPASNFYLSLGLDYPNPSDRILGDQGHLGGDIFIHGACVTIGCLPITNTWIKELYVYCVEARNSGQDKIPVTIFPGYLEAEDYNALIENPGFDPSAKELWEDLKKGYDLFHVNKRPPVVTFLNSGRHDVK